MSALAALLQHEKRSTINNLRGDLRHTYDRDAFDAALEQLIRQGLVLRDRQYVQWVKPSASPSAKPPSLVARMGATTMNLFADWTSFPFVILLNDETSVRLFVERAGGLSEEQAATFAAMTRNKPCTLQIVPGPFALVPRVAASATTVAKQWAALCTLLHQPILPDLRWSSPTAPPLRIHLYRAHVNRERHACLKFSCVACDESSDATTMRITQATTGQDMRDFVDRNQRAYEAREGVWRPWHARRAWVQSSATEETCMQTLLASGASTPDAFVELHASIMTQADRDLVHAVWERRVEPFICRQVHYLLKRLQTMAIEWHHAHATHNDHDHAVATMRTKFEALKVHPLARERVGSSWVLLATKLVRDLERDETWIKQQLMDLMVALFDAVPVFVPWLGSRQCIVDGDWCMENPLSKWCGVDLRADGRIRRIELSRLNLNRDGWSMRHHNRTVRLPACLWRMGALEVLTLNTAGMCSTIVVEGSPAPTLREISIRGATSVRMESLEAWSEPPIVESVYDIRALDNDQATILYEKTRDW
jgi:hypothetical protein